MSRTFPLLWRPVAPVVVYLHMPKPGNPTVSIHAGTWCDVELRTPNGVVYSASVAGSPVVAATETGPAGVWTITISPGPQTPTEPAEVPLWVAANQGCPFVVLGPGVVPSHFPAPEPLLRIEGSKRPFNIWCWVAPGLNRLTLQSLFAPARIPELVTPNGNCIALAWKPGTGAQQSVSVAISEAGWYRVPIAPGPAGRFTTYEGVPLFAEPCGELPLAHLAVQVTNNQGANIPARMELYRQGQRWAIYDCIHGETVAFHTMPGPVELRVSQGFTYRPEVRALTLAAGEQHLQINMQPELITPQGWLCGDHHVHSYCEDGGQPPETVVRAAAAAGLSYVFITDVPEPLFAENFDRYNRPGQFLALPGQECTNPDCHCNALNMRQTLSCPHFGAAPAEYPGPANWLQQVREQGSEHPALLMLNHPSHLPPASQVPYFHSWAQADDNSDITLVENCDFTSWFARLNTGRRITALWTTDTHDVAWIPTGMRRSYVYVGEPNGSAWTDADIIAGLAAGRVFNTRFPGALLFFTVNGQMPNTQMSTSGGMATITIECQSTRPLRQIELVVNGKVLAVWPANGVLHFSLEQGMELPANGWVLVRAYAHEEPWPRDGHSMEPMTATWCVAFTNPVYLA